ncbi:hypothetical protein BS47DRAFT_1486191 [Hydnum rufescens UP504]|uniref:Zn(2)-C6 fungal-type domain-containing protein n=1 Tax=Hydnum rufescens UP504 TaxID=1448309 RepID=A0A9P6DRS4_9AGAM|nr:hypothetical protein BS47DRAFT_1486191 [Hydnum rufescens UP504]
MPNSETENRRVACMECRRIKTKCSGGSICTRCLRLYKPCYYESGQHQPRLLYLQEKILRLEKEIQLASNRSAPNSHEIVQKLAKAGDAHKARLGPPRPSMPVYPRDRHGPALLMPGSVSRSDYEEGYGSVLPRSIVESSFLRWDQVSDISAELRGYLVRLFIPFRGQYNFHVNVPKFLERLDLPQEHPASLHPALLNVIYLGHPHAPRAFPRLADRLTHFMWTSQILAIYYGLTSRILEAYNTMSAAVRFAIGCGLHRKRADSALDSIHLPPEEEIQADDPMTLWYAMYHTDALISAGGSLPTSVPEKCATSFDTLFPLRMTKARTTAKVKVTALFSAITYFSHTIPGEQPTILTLLKIMAAKLKFDTLATALSKLQHALPPVDDVLGLQPFEAVSPINPNLVPIHYGFYISAILLLNCVIDDEPEAYQKVLEAALAMAQLARRMRARVLLHLFMHLQQLWCPHIYGGCEVFVREMRRVKARSSPEEAYDYFVAEQGLEALLDTLYDLTTLYPIWLPCMQKLRVLLEGSEAYLLI